jgi:hypothetical protein
MRLQSFFFLRKRRDSTPRVEDGCARTVELQHAWNVPGRTNNFFFYAYVYMYQLSCCMTIDTPYTSPSFHFDLLCMLAMFTLRAITLTFYSCHCVRTFSSTKIEGGGHAGADRRASSKQRTASTNVRDRCAARRPSTESTRPAGLAPSGINTHAHRRDDRPPQLSSVRHRSVRAITIQKITS